MAEAGADSRAIAAPRGNGSVHLDALRGLAAFSVCISHWRDAFFVDYRAVPDPSLGLTAWYTFADLGHQWVIVFFVMSGYLVGGSALRAMAKGRWSWRAYAAARLTRLYIVLLPALLLGGLADWVGMRLPGAQALYSGRSGMVAFTANVYQTLTPGVLLGNLGFLQTLALPGSGGHLFPVFGSNGPLWSLANEFWYYAAFPLLALALGRGQSPRNRLLHGLALLGWGWLVGGSIFWMGIPWLTGILLVYLPRLPERSRLRRGLWPWVGVALAVLLFLGGMLLDKVANTYAAHALLGLVVTALIWALLQDQEPNRNHGRRLPGWYRRLAQSSARSSYTLYLIHLPLLILLKAALRLPRAMPSWPGFAASLPILAIVLLAAQLVYQLFEKHTDRVRAWVMARTTGDKAQ